MDPLKITKQMIDFNKVTFDNSFQAMVLLQEQTEKIVDSLLQQATWLPGEGKKLITDWVATFKKGREEFKKNIDETYKKVEAYFAEAQKGRSETA